MTRAYPWFLWHEPTRSISTPPWIGMVNCRVTPSAFAATHLIYTWVERGTVRVKCLPQEQKVMTPATA